jgi:hypothetical protein
MAVEYHPEKPREAGFVDRDDAAKPILPEDHPSVAMTQFTGHGGP